MKSSEYIVLGLMSGTSLDGVDIAICSFVKSASEWNHKLLYSYTYQYNAQWKSLLSQAEKLSSDKLIKLDREYGNFLGELINDSVKQSGIKPVLIASHGHTVFHKPDEGYSCQIGHGANIALTTGIDVVADFRSNDVANGGQGAPLVPFGDKFLYGKYQSCLNLGGFSNISFDWEGKRIAFDICPVNIILNYLATKTGFDYDKNGALGKRGKTNDTLLLKLNSLHFYNDSAPKSLSKEWLNKEFLPVIDHDNSTLEDKLSTIYDHVVFQIVKILKEYNLNEVFVTGGGTHNNYLVHLLNDSSNVEFIIPDIQTIDYKEAIVFGFLGLMRNLNLINCLASVTGAMNNSICGAVYLGDKKK